MTAGCRLDVDNHHATFLLLLARRRYGRGSVLAIRLDWKLDAAPLVFAAPFLFLLQDFFDDPGIQHLGPSFVVGLTDNQPFQFPR